MSLVLALTLFISIAASPQTSSPQSDPSAQAPQATPSPEAPQTEPSNQNPAATPAPEPQSMPSQSAPSQSSPAQSSPVQSSPSQSAPPSQAAPNTQQGNQPASIDDELQLTPDQKQKIASVVDDENRQISAVRDDNSMSLEQKQQKVMQIRQAGTPKIKAILTPEQLQKLAVIQQRMREQNGSGSQNGNQGTTQPPPQH
jgi:Spy/CpxP family protein refolding chaperone